MECSRIPKCSILPPESPASKLPAPGVGEGGLVGGPRSADPPSSHGIFCARTFNTLPDASRPAMPFGSAGKVGRLRSQPAGNSRFCIWSISAASRGTSRCTRRIARSTACVRRRRACRSHRRSAGRRRPAPGTWHPRAIRRLPWRAGLPRLRAVRHAPRTYRACAGNRIRCELSSTIKVGRPFVCRNASSACSMRSMSLASGTRSTFQP